MGTRKRRNGWLGRLGRGAALAFLLLVSVAAGAAAAVAAFFAAAHMTDSVRLLALAGGLALVAITGVLSAAACAWLLRPGAARRWLPAVITAAVLAAVGFLAAAVVFEPMDVTYVAMTPGEEARYWDLPTGSRIAYSVARAEEPAAGPPVIMLHGGPGGPGSLEPQAEDPLLAAAGFDVYRYHQVGAGLSSRLEDVSGYTVDRHVSDLEAIREAIGAERVVLVGGSWGGQLAAYYIARHPERVARAVFLSPGALWRPAWSEGRDDPVPESDGPEVDIVADAATLRFAIAYWLLQINPRAAHALASDEELSGFFQPLMGQVIAQDVAACGEEREAVDAAPPAARRGVPAGLGFYAMMVTNASLEMVDDPRPVLRQVDIPVLVLRGECDRLRPEVHREYRDVFRDSLLLELDGVGHSVVRAPGYPQILRAFIRGDPIERS